MGEFIIENYNIITQAVGIVAMACMVLSVQFKNNTVYFSMQLIGGVLFVVHYGMFGAWGGCLINVVACAVNVILLLGDRTQKLPFLIAILGLYAGVTALVLVMDWDTPLVLLSCVAQYAATLGMWTRDHIKLRVVRLFVVSPLWIIYNLINRSIGGVVCELFNMISVIVYFVRIKLGKSGTKYNER